MINDILPPGSRGSVDNGEGTPSSVPGSPSPGHGIGLPGGSGRVSRQSDIGSGRLSPGTAIGRYTNSTDHVIER
jgi:dynein intermediate chain